MCISWLLCILYLVASKSGACEGYGFVKVVVLFLFSLNFVSNCFICSILIICFN